ncbi:MAG: MBL fold metallo-hydrolase [Sagittula sp.]|uniref:MBL fold metallo-hydrolase n=1 Tax=Sagittula sp. TaxID=2038081 RepID=UPI00405804EE
MALQNATDTKRDAPFAAPPGPSEVIEVAPGILWLRFPLPFLLDHVNVYLIEDDGGWALFDTGIGDERTREIWRAAFAGPLKGMRLTRMILSHHHPDHMGLAGWISRRLDIPVYMTLTEFLMGKFLGSGENATRGEFYADYYRIHGLDPTLVQGLIDRGHRYLETITPLPDSFHTLAPEVPLRIGGRTFSVLTGGGHSPDQAMLWCKDDNLFLAADQILEHISPNVSVHAMEPEANPLGRFIDSLTALQQVVAPDALTLPGHRLPLTFPLRRARELIAHHGSRCDRMEAIIGRDRLSVAEIAPRLFDRKLDEHQMTFAFSETLAHANHMVAEGRLRWEDEGGIRHLRVS